MNDYRWIQERSEGLYYAELQELIQTIDWTLAWKQLKEAFLPYIQIWNKAMIQVLENLRNNPEFIAAAKNYMNTSAMTGGSNLAGKSWNTGNPMKYIQEFQKQIKPKIEIKPEFPKPVKVGYMTYPEYHSTIDCENLISPTKEQNCKDKKR